MEGHWVKYVNLKQLRVWLDYGFNQLKIQKICFTDIENKQSKKKILKKIGLQSVSEFDDDGTPSTWLAHQKTDY
jgi:RimJ/RimL family protein N-acetyltransferase